MPSPSLPISEMVMWLTRAGGIFGDLGIGQMRFEITKRHAHGQSVVCVAQFRIKPGMTGVIAE